MKKEINLTSYKNWNKPDEFDEVWIYLMLKAKQSGLSTQEIRDFLHKDRNSIQRYK